MSEIYIAGTGIWYPDESISNDEIVESFNSYVDTFNAANKDAISNDQTLKLEYSSTEFIAVSYTHLTLPTKRIV